MKATLFSYDSALNLLQPDQPSKDFHLVMGFGDKSILARQDIYERLRADFPAATILLNSTAGEIHNMEVRTGTLSLVGMSFDKTQIRHAAINIRDYSDSFEAGQQLVRKLDPNELKYILVISDGGLVNGSELVRGIEGQLEHRIPVTGGLAGDGARFESTLVGLNSQPVQGTIAAIGFYGDHIKIGHGSMGGWEVFGPERTVTNSNANQLFEIEGKNALTVYKTYLGKYADELPGSALLFPLSVKEHEDSKPVVRTILKIDESNNSMTFAGDIPKGSKVRFMKANFDKLVDAAYDAANSSFSSSLGRKPSLALLVSCVGRKIILDSRVEEEVEAVARAFESGTPLAGFYSYGEISPFNPGSKCELHNQTMTITTFDED